MQIEGKFEGRNPTHDSDIGQLNKLMPKGNRKECFNKKSRQVFSNTSGKEIQIIEELQNASLVESKTIGKNYNADIS